MKKSSVIVALLLTILTFISCKGKNTASEPQDNLAAKEDTIEDSAAIAGLSKEISVEKKSPRVTQEITENVTRIPTGFYAVSSPEGLNLRAAPDFSSEKVCLLAYQETVKLLSIGDKKVTIDGITSYWYEVSEPSDYWNSHTGYAFGGYLEPLYTVKIKDYDNQKVKMSPIDMEKIDHEVEELLTKQEARDCPWNLEDGFYYPKAITFHNPGLYPISYSVSSEPGTYGGNENVCYCYIKDGKLYYILNNVVRLRNGSVARFNSPRIDHNEIEISENYEIFPKESIDAYSSYRSGGGEYEIIGYEDETLECYYHTNYFSREESVTYELAKDSEYASINYEISFPWFIQGSANIPCWSTPDVAKINDLVLKGNMKPGDEYESLPGDNETLAELTDMKLTDDGIIYGGFYRGKKFWIKAKNIDKVSTSANDYRMDDGYNEYGL